MIDTLFNDNWKFWLEGDSFALVWNIPSNAQDITLPHDAMMAGEPHAESLNKGNTGFFDGAVYTYVKLMNVPADYRDKTVMLKFEGIYMKAFVYINGQLAAKCPNGYTTFYVPMNDFLKYGQENEIRVSVRNSAMTNSRWYSGGGIYRDVYLLVAEPAYLIPDGVQIVTETADDEFGVIQVSTEIKNRYYYTADLRVETVIEDAQGVVVNSDVYSVSLFAGQEKKISRRMTIAAPKKWSAETPDLYSCQTRIYLQDKLLDTNKTQFGIRTLQLDSKRGLRVNGQPVNLRGACIHHDSGLIGAATYEDAQMRQVRMLKAAGFNAIRMAHHPMAPALLRACDRYGMYVMDESFDMWTRFKSDNDYAQSFSEWWEFDLEAMVRKDMNHPSVIMYSLGNEIPEIGTNLGADWCRKMVAKVKSLDSSRYTLASINGIFVAGDSLDKIVMDVIEKVNCRAPGTIDGNVNNFMAITMEYADDVATHPIISGALDKACAATDIAGYNYMTGRYEQDAIDYPNRVIVGSETFTFEIARNWDLVERLSHLIGDFTWTGWDYIGEAGIGVPGYQFGEGGFGAKFPCRLAFCGDFDLTGFRRPASYYRELVFGLRTAPYIAVHNVCHYGEKLLSTPWIFGDTTASWTWPGSEGKPALVEVYSAGTEVELICNGQSLGRKPAGKDVGFKTVFETIYTPGEIKAMTWQDGEIIGEMSLQTALPERKLIIESESSEPQQGQLIYLPISICDTKGTIATDEDARIKIDVQGAARLLGFGSGNPRPTDSYTGTETAVFNGRALAILKAGEAAGSVQIRVTAEGFATAELTLAVR